MRIQKRFSRLAQVSLLASIIGLAGCGGSSSTDGATTTTVSGSVFASYVDGAEVTVYDENDNVVAGPVSTTNGSYSIVIPRSKLAGLLRFVSSGGTFTDEATGETVTAGEMATYIPAGGFTEGDEVHATPASTIIHHMVVRHGMGHSAAQTAFNGGFDYTPDHTIEPTDATAPEDSALKDQLEAGLRAAKFSQLTQALGLTPAQQFALLQALAQDLSDGVLDGDDAGGQVAIPGAGENLSPSIATQLDDATNAFRTGTKTSTNYQFEYIQGSMAEMEGTMLRHGPSAIRCRHIHQVIARQHPVFPL